MVAMAKHFREFSVCVGFNDVVASFDNGNSILSALSGTRGNACVSIFQCQLGSSANFRLLRLYGAMQEFH